MERGNAPVRMAWTLTGLVYLQILAGAVLRHLGAGLAIPDFPLSFGRVIPDFISTGILAAFVHRAGGFVVAAAVIVMAVRLLRYEREHPLRALGTLLLAVVFAQVLLGGYVIWSGKQPHITSLHVMVGAFTLALSVVLTLSARTLAWAQSQLPVVRSGSETMPPTANRQPSTVSHHGVPV